MIPNMLLQKFPAESFTVTTKIEASLNKTGQQGGLIIMGLDYASLRLLIKQNDLFLEYAKCIGAEEGKKEIIETQLPVNENVIFLQVEVNPGAICQFRYSLNGSDFTNIGDMFKAREGKWIGAKVGLYSIMPEGTDSRGYIDVDWFRFTK